MRKHNIQKKAGTSVGLFVLYMIACGACFVVLNIQTASAQSTRELMNRLNRMEKEVDTLNRAVYKGEKPLALPPPIDYGDDNNANASGSGTKQAAQEIRMQQLEGEIQELTGTVEEYSNKIRQLELQLERVTSDLTLRVSDLEQGKAPGGGLNTLDFTNPMSDGSPQDLTGNNAQTSSAAPLSPNSATGYQWNSNGNRTNEIIAKNADVLYQTAFDRLKAGEYAASEREFQKFVRDYPQHELAGNAQYWLGETHYVRKDYEKAARAFATGYQQYPKNTKAPDNLLKLGMSLASLGQKDEACITLNQIKKQFDTSVSTILTRADQEMNRLACPDVGDVQDEVPVQNPAPQYVP